MREGESEGGKARERETEIERDSESERERGTHLAILVSDERNKDSAVGDSIIEDILPVTATADALHIQEHPVSCHLQGFPQSYGFIRGLSVDVAEQDLIGRGPCRRERETERERERGRDTGREKRDLTYISCCKTHIKR